MPRLATPEKPEIRAVRSENLLSFGFHHAGPA